MEKYCKSCGAVFNDLKFKLCPYCGGELDTRYGRQPIPRKLRHEVFKRDGYRCRECGASKDETSLEIDHILPVAKGGTNDIDNLQTLCRECNRMKHTDTWAGGKTDLEVVKNELESLKDKLNESKGHLNIVTDENDVLDCKFKILKLEEKIVSTEKKLYDMIKEDNEKKKKLQEELDNRKRKEILYKKLYVELSLDELRNLHKFFKYGSKDKIIKYLILKYNEEEIISIINNKILPYEMEFQHLTDGQLKVLYNYEKNMTLDEAAKIMGNNYYSHLVKEWYDQGKEGNELYKEFYDIINILMDT